MGTKENNMLNYMLQLGQIICIIMLQLGQIICIIMLQLGQIICIIMLQLGQIIWIYVTTKLTVDDAEQDCNKDKD